MINRQRCKEGFAPAVKNRKGEIFLPTNRGEEIHGDIYQRLEPFTKRELATLEQGNGLDLFFRRMTRKGYVEGFVILKTGEFLDRDEMEKHYGGSETMSLKNMYAKGL